MSLPSRPPAVLPHIAIASVFTFIVCDPVLTVHHSDQDTKSSSIDALVFDVHGLPGTASLALLSVPTRHIVRLSLIDAFFFYVFAQQHTSVLRRRL